MAGGGRRRQVGNLKGVSRGLSAELGRSEEPALPSVMMCRGRPPTPQLIPIQAIKEGSGPEKDEARAPVG